MLVRLKKILPRIVLFSIALMLVPAAYAGTILTGVEYSSDENYIHIRAKFGDKVDYLKHFPSNRGKIVQMQIRLVGNKFSDKAQKRREVISPQDDAPSIVRDIIYEGNVRGGPYLVLRFSSVVRFELGKEKNSDVITVSIDKKELNALDMAQQANKNVGGANSEEESRADKLMSEGRRALTEGMNSEAILSFTEILQMPENKYSQDAKEYLGLARERNGQLDMAKQQYTEYLSKYPDTRKTNTVRQRLMTLNARMDQIERQLKEGKRTAQANGARQPGQLFGRVAQLFYNAGITRANEDPQWVQSRLLSFFDVTRRWRDEDKDARLTFSGSHDWDRLNGSQSAGDAGQASTDYSQSKLSDFRIRSAYGDYKGRRNKIHAALGRQSVNSGGVLGRFDGLLLGYELKKDLSVYGVAGTPVDYQKNISIQTDKPMVGGRIDFDKLGKSWKASIYGIQQNVDNIIDRRAVGGDIRYFENKKIFYSLVDYDISYRTLSFFTSHFGWQVTPKAKLDFHVDSRRSPIMLTSNALRVVPTLENDGNPEHSIAGLDFSKLGDLDKFKSDPTIAGLLNAGVSEAQIRKLAQDHTGHSTLFTTGFNYELAKDLSVIANATLASYQPGVADSEVAEDEQTSDNPLDNLTTPFLKSSADKIVAFQLVKRNMFKDRDIVLFGVRGSANDRNRRFSSNITLRSPLKEKWWIDLRGRIMYTQQFDNPDTESDETGTAVRISPTVRTEYRITKQLTFEIEGGADINKSSRDNEDYNWIFLNTGYRYLF